MHGALVAASRSLSFAVRRAATTARRASFSECGKSKRLMKSTSSSARRPPRAPARLRPATSADRAEGLPRGVARLRRGEQHVEARELRRLPRAPERCVLAELRELVGRLASGHLQRGPEGAGRNRVHANALGRELLRESL